MDDLKQLLAKRIKERKPIPQLHSPAHSLADEISTAFGERKLFARYLGTINRVGVDEARRVFRQIQQEGNAKSPGKLFMFLCKKAKTEERPMDTAAEAAAAYAKKKERNKPPTPAR